MGPQYVGVDSAFAYFIVDNGTGALLFAGTLTDPSKVKVPEVSK